MMAGVGGMGSAWRANPAPRGAGEGEQMLNDVDAYDAMGEHRTATAGDHAASDWLRRRLEQAGMQAELQPFDVPLFVPHHCEVRVQGAAVPTFPAWPVRQTPIEGIAAPQTPREAASLEGRIAVVRLPRATGLWDTPGMGEVVLETCRRGPRAVIAVTEGPTGAVVAMNAAPARFDWPVPVVIAPGAQAERLSNWAVAGAPAVLACAGQFSPAARATNVVARRRGSGRTIVVSTPKSGWFHCAGERGTGLAVFLDLAAWLARNSQADLVFVAFAGHELDYLGGQMFLKAAAPAPGTVRLWLHIGANAAMQPLSVADGAARPAPAVSPGRRVTASAGALAAAGRAFTGEAGYGPPVEMTQLNAAGELSIIRKAGYGDLAGIIGANPLFHTALDRAGVATTPAQLQAVSQASRAFLRGFARVERDAP
jgi:hypothetical protein